MLSIEEGADIVIHRWCRVKPDEKVLIITDDTHQQEESFGPSIHTLASFVDIISSKIYFYNSFSQFRQKGWGFVGNDKTPAKPGHNRISAIQSAENFPLFHRLCRKIHPRPGTCPDGGHEWKTPGFCDSPQDLGVGNQWAPTSLFRLGFRGLGSGTETPSRCRRYRLRSTPPEYPPRVPLDAITRWQGMRMGSGFRPLA